MKVVAVALHGFRPFRDRVVISLGPITTLVGKNDAGKSALLHALNAFFNDVIDEADFNNGFDPNAPITIECSFVDLPEKLELEEGVYTTFLDENLVDHQRRLTIRKSFSRKSLKKPKISLLVNDYAESQYMNLCSLREADLNKRGNEVGLDLKKSGAGITNKSKRAALRAHAEAKGFQKKVLEIEPAEVLLRILELLPDYNLFQADVRLSEEETSFQKEFKAVVEMAISKIPARGDVEQVVEKEIDNEVGKIHGFLLQHTDEVASLKARPSFKWKDLVSFHLECKDNQGASIAFGKRGSGLRRLLMVAYFQYLSQRGRSGESLMNYLFAIEEPETFLHPGAQRALLGSLEEVARHAQVVVTSHSPVFAGGTEIPNLVLVRREGGRAEAIQGQNLDTLRVAEELGVDPSDQVFGFKACVFVEGESDVYFLTKAVELLKADGCVDATFQEKGIGLIALGGGDSLKHWIARDCLKKINMKFGVLVDSDRKNAEEEVPTRKHQFKEKCEADGGVFFITRKREIENYLHPAAIYTRDGAPPVFDDFSDMRALFGDDVHRAVGRMNATQLLERDVYVRDGKESHEILEIIGGFLSLAG